VLNWSIEGNLTPRISGMYAASVRVYFASDDEITKPLTIRAVKVRLTNVSVRVTALQNFWIILGFFSQIFKNFNEMYDSRISIYSRTVCVQNTTLLRSIRWRLSSYGIEASLANTRTYNFDIFALREDLSHKNLLIRGT
jgi:hypothetical protein